MLSKVSFNLIKENHGLNEDDVIAEHVIPTTFDEEIGISLHLMKRQSS
jgi:hypothetical protein